MLTNATILRIDTPGAAGGGGERVWTQGPALAARCFAREMTRADKYDAGIQGSLLEEDLTLVQVAIAELTRALKLGGYSSTLVITSEWKLLVQPDVEPGQPPAPSVLYRVRKAGFRRMGAISHREFVLMVD